MRVSELCHAPHPYPLMGSQREYYEFMGYDTDLLRQRYGPYADRFPAGARVLDVGCGRGEFMELVAARGATPVGVDVDEEMVSAVKAMGMDAEVADAVAYLRAHPAEFDGVFNAHLIEHLPSERMVALVRAAAGALRPGGRLVVVTPSPANLQMHLRDFWVDLQHVRFYAPDSLRWVFHEAGLRDVEAGENELYRSEIPLPTIEPFDLGSPPSPLPPLRLRARARERLGEWLQPASSLERIQRTEEMSAYMQRLEAGVMAMRDWLAGLFPPAEFWVSGVR